MIEELSPSIHHAGNTFGIGDRGVSFANDLIANSSWVHTFEWNRNPISEMRVTDPREFAASGIEVQIIVCSVDGTIWSICHDEFPRLLCFTLSRRAQGGRVKSTVF
jgi:hypothetical protein